MNSIYYSYFITKGIFLLMILVIGYSVYKKELPKLILFIFIPLLLLLFSFLAFITFSTPNIFENISVYQKLQNLKPENVKEINVFDISFTDNNNEPIPNSLYTLKNKVEIEFILNTLKRNEFYNESYGVVEKIYGLTIILKDKSEIYFNIIKSKKNAYPELLNRKNGKYYNIGSYKNNSISKILIE